MEDIDPNTHSSPPQLQSSMEVAINLNELSDIDAEGEDDDDYLSELFGSNASQSAACQNDSTGTVLDQRPQVNTIDTTKSVALTTQSVALSTTETVRDLHPTAPKKPCLQMSQIICVTESVPEVLQVVACVDPEVTAAEKRLRSSKSGSPNSTFPTNSTVVVSHATIGSAEKPIVISDDDEAQKTPRSWRRKVQRSDYLDWSHPDYEKHVLDKLQTRWYGIQVLWIKLRDLYVLEDNIKIQHHDQLMQRIEKLARDTQTLSPIDILELQTSYDDVVKYHIPTSKRPGRSMFKTLRKALRNILETSEIASSITVVRGGDISKDDREYRPSKRLKR